MPIRVFLFFLFTCLVAVPVFANRGNARDADRTLSPYFVVENAGSAVETLPLTSTRVDVAITSVIAHVTVTQTYENSGTRPIHAKYVFPASTRAAVHGLKMAIGDQVIVAKIKEREQAQREFESAKRSGKSATLLEQERPNVFTMNVSNVMPGDRIDVTLRYTELLLPTGASYEFVYPTVVGPRYSNRLLGPGNAHARWVETPYQRSATARAATLTIRGTLSAGMPVQTFASSSHRVNQTRAGDRLDFELDASERLSANRDFVVRYRLAGEAVQSGLTLYDSGTEQFFLLLLEPPARPKPETLPAREYVFIVDVSGSMHGFPLDTAKQLLSQLVSALRPRDRFNVLLFSGGATLLSERSLEGTPENVAAALAVLDAEQGGGGTELLPAMRRALALSQESALSRSFVIVTDGFVEADKPAMDFVRANLGSANVFAFGIGSSVNRYLIEGLARAGLGEPFIVTEPSAAATAAARFREYVGAPVLTDVRVSYDRFSAYDVEPAVIPDVFAARPVVVFGKWRGPKSGTLRISGVSGAGSYQKQFDVATASLSPRHEALEYLWARTRIARLSEFSFAEPSANDRAAVLGLGLRYNLLTRYTSFIAVSERVRNPGGGATAVKQPLPLPAGVSDMAVGSPMTGAPEPELLLMLGAIGLLVAARFAWRTARRYAVTPRTSS